MNAPRIVLALLVLVAAACGVQTPVEPGAGVVHHSQGHPQSDTTTVETSSPWVGGAN